MIPNIPGLGGRGKDDKESEADLGTSKPENILPGMLYFEKLYKIEDKFIKSLKRKSNEARDLRQATSRSKIEIENNLNQAIQSLDLW